MKRGEIHLPEDKQKIVDKAWRHEIWSIVAMISIIALLGFTMARLRR